MFCQNCGRGLPIGVGQCPSCGAPVLPPPPVPPPPPAAGGAPPDSFEQLVSETKRAARELARATAVLSQKALSHAGSAAKDPRASAKKVASRVSKELDDAAKEIDRILKGI